jgi:methylglutaconyl-CoA hydratase
MTYRTLEWKLEGLVGTITLSRPEKRNALSKEMIVEFLDALDVAEASAARVLIITGAGKAFCAGMDIDELRAIAQQTPKEHREESQRIATMFRRLYTYPKAIIAAVNGAAIAGGSGIASLADFTLAVPEAKFGYTEVKIGFIPALVSVFLKRQVAGKHVRDLVLTGRIVDAAEAFRMGLVTELVPAGNLMARTRELADSLLALSPTSITRTKKLFTKLDAELLDAEIAVAVHENADIRSTADFTEGVTSFLEKRTPQWTGR